MTWILYKDYKIRECFREYSREVIKQDCRFRSLFRRQIYILQRQKWQAESVSEGISQELQHDSGYEDPAPKWLYLGNTFNNVPQSWFNIQKGIKFEMKIIFKNNGRTYYILHLKRKLVCIIWSTYKRKSDFQGWCLKILLMCERYGSISEERTCYQRISSQFKKIGFVSIFVGFCKLSHAPR